MDGNDNEPKISHVRHAIDKNKKRGKSKSKLTQHVKKEDWKRRRE